MDTQQLPNPKHMRGDFSFELANKILDKLLEGYSVTQIAKMRGFPKRRTIQWWIAKGRISAAEVTDKNRHLYQFRQEYLQARESQSEDIYEKIIAIEQKVESGEMLGPAGNVLLKSLRWRASQMDLKRFNRKNQGGPDKISYEVVVSRERITGPKTVVPLISHDANS